MKTRLFLRSLVAVLTVLTLSRSAFAQPQGPFSFNVRAEREARTLKISGLVTTLLGIALMNGGAGYAGVENLGQALSDQHSKANYTGPFVLLGVGAATIAIGVPLWIVGVRRLNRLHGVQITPSGLAW
jgi:hypothetical protein